jgi:hypothetical protein
MYFRFPLQCPLITWQWSKPRNGPSKGRDGTARTASNATQEHVGAGYVHALSILVSDPPATPSLYAVTNGHPIKLHRQ